MEAQIQYTRRIGIIELTDKAEPIPDPLLPEKVVLELLQCKKGFDVGALCYRRVKKLRIGHKDGSLKEVDESSLDKSRREPVKKLLDYIKAGGSKKRNKDILTGIAQFQQWIDENEPNIVSVLDPVNVKRLYQGYTQNLIRRLNLPDIPKNKKIKIGNNYASLRQAYAAIWCSCLTGFPETDIQFWAPKITQKRNMRAVPSGKPVTIDDCNRTMAALIGIIDLTWESLIKNEKEEIAFENEIVSLTTEAERDMFLRKLLVIALMSFIGATGANLDVAISLKIRQGEVKSATPGMKYTGIKYRAYGREVYLEFGAKYFKHWKRYLQLRDLILRGEYSDLLFPYRDRSGTIGPLNKVRLYNQGNGSTIPEWFEATTGEKWIVATKWRKNRDLQINQVNGNDVVQTAEMQGRSVAVTLQHYQNRDLTVAAKEISNALDSIYEAAIKRSRTKESIHVKIVADFKRSSQIPTGQCESQDLTPKLANGFTDKNPVTPDCKTKEGCIFCEFYSVHADERDMRKLLSLRFLCDELKQSMPHEQFVSNWSPVIYRIDEILSEILTHQPDLEAAYQNIASEVELGELDGYWSKRVDILLNLGVIA